MEKSNYLLLMSHHHDHSNHHHHPHDHNSLDSHQNQHESRTKWVVLLTAITMVAEIGFGYYTNSMALLADGWHMSSHVLAIGLTWFAYWVARRNHDNPRFVAGTGKILALSGYTSALLLQVIAIWMAIESVARFLNPQEIMFGEAIVVAVVGLIVNAVSAVMLHHKREDSDHNIRAAYLHVIADALTSLTAIAALTAGWLWKIYALDAVSGVICSIIITKWAYDLAKNSGKDLLDYK